MYKYITEKLSDNALSAPNICLIAFEMCKDEHSEVLEDFLSRSAVEICQVLGWKNNEKNKALIESSIDEEDFVGLLYRNNRTGFLANVLLPVCDRVSIDEETGEPNAWHYSAGLYKVDFVYADTVGEVTEKVISLQEKYLEDCLAKQIKKEKGDEH